MKRLAALCLLGAALAAGCGGSDPPATKAPAPTKAQLAARELLAELEGDCDCTGEARAKERVEDGRASAPTGAVILAP